jgi:hypothetical protein
MRTNEPSPRKTRNANLSEIGQIPSPVAHSVSLPNLRWPGRLGRRRENEHPPVHVLLGRLRGLGLASTGVNSRGILTSTFRVVKIKNVISEIEKVIGVPEPFGHAWIPPWNWHCWPLLQGLEIRGRPFHHVGNWRFGSGPHSDGICAESGPCESVILIFLAG